MSSSANQINEEKPSAKMVALIVTATDGIESLAADLASRLGVTIEVASGRATALRLLSRRGYAAVILDQILADSDPDGAERIWKNAGLAIPLQVNFALAGSARLEREIRAALARREREQRLAGAAAAAALDDDLKNAITGFLLESRLALAEQEIPPEVENRLRTLAAMADRLRERLQPTVERGTTSVALLAPPK